MIDSIRGIVRHGDKRGRTIGYPTVNIDLHRPVRTGVYAAVTKVNGKWLPSMAFIGVAKTFGNTVKRAESHILDFKGDLYGSYVTVRLLAYIRPNKRFDTPKQLIQAIKHDEHAIRTFFKNTVEYKK